MNLSRRSYFAFISYSHADNQQEGRRWASWLHEALESYEVPANLIGMEGKEGQTIPMALFPVFRDEEEFSAEGDLKGSIEAALADSQFLVVICSPNSARSKYVDAEVRTFKEMPGKHGRIIALIVDGVPFSSRQPGADAGRECLPPSLRMGQAREDGSIDWTLAAEPLCADTRIGGRDLQGYTSAAEYRSALEHAPEKTSPAAVRKMTAEYARRLDRARMKVIAGVMGVRLGSLTRATNRFRIQRLRRALAVVGSLAVAALMAAAWALLAQHRENRERLAAEHANSQANRLINEMLGDLGDKLRPLGKLELLKDVSEAAKAYFVDMPEGQEKAGISLQRAVMWLGHGDVVEALGRDDEALKSYYAAQTTLEAIGVTAPDAKPQAKRLHAISFERIADVLEDGDVTHALDAARRAVELINDLLANPRELRVEQLQQDLGQAHERVGDILEDGAANLAEARFHFQQSKNIRKALSERLGGEQPGYRRDYGVACARIGDVLKMEGSFEQALSAFEEGLAVRESLLKTHGLNAEWIGEISRSLESLGHVQEALGQNGAAMKSHERALGIRQVLSAYNPPDKKVQGNLARSCFAVARLKVAEGKMKEAESLLERARLIQQACIEEKKPDIKVGIDLVGTLSLEAAWHQESRRWSKAQDCLDKAVAVADALRSAAKDKASDNAKLDIAEARLHTCRARLHQAIKPGEKPVANLLQAGIGTLRPRIISNPDNVELRAELLWMEGLLAGTSQDAQGLQATIHGLQELMRENRLAAEGKNVWLPLLQDFLKPGPQGPQ